VAFNNGNAWNSVVNPPSTDGSLVYVQHDSNLASVGFSGGAFGVVHDSGALAFSVLGQVAIANGLLFGDTNGSAHLYSLTTTFAASANWTLGTSAAIGGVLNSPAVVGTNYVFGPATNTEGHFHAFDKITPATSFQWALGAGAASRIGTSSSPAFGADEAIYFVDGIGEMVPLKVTSNTPALVGTWGSTFQGSTTQTITAGPSNTLIDGTGTEPTIDTSGILYFGTPAGKVFAIITDSGGTLAPVPGSTWPRVGYDNCNSGNTSFVCR
jgi:hypothetical protein